MTVVEICNLALGHLGEAPITALNDDTAAARACSLHYASTRDAVLRAHRWNFAVLRAELSLAWVGITGAADDGDGLIEITKASHGLATGTRVRLRDAGGVTDSDGEYNITSTGTDTFTLDDSTFAGAYTSGGEYVVIPAFTWDYQFSMPSDCLRILEFNDTDIGDIIDSVFVVEGRKLLTNESTAQIAYIQQVTDPALFDALFIEALTLKLAAALSESIRGTTGKTGELLTQYERIVAPTARRVDANEGKRRKGLLPLNSHFVRARSEGV